MEEQSASFSYTKLEKIQNQIDDLQKQKEKMIQNLEQKLMSFLKNKDAFSQSFETLLGGIDEIIDSLQNKKPSQEQILIHQKWKKNGSQILKKEKTKNSKNTNMETENK